MKLLVNVVLFCWLCLPLGSEEWTAKDYVNNAFLQFKWAKNFFFDRYTWSGDKHVLDIGHGDGRITHLISEYVPPLY